MLIVLVIRRGGLLYSIVAQQYRTCARVFAKHQIGIFQYLYSPVSNITKVTNRRWNEVQAQFLWQELKVKIKKTNVKSRVVSNQMDHSD